MDHQTTGICLDELRRCQKTTPRPNFIVLLGDRYDLRLLKILCIIGECRLGIHDISRTELDAASGLPRFNMPLELGLRGRLRCSSRWGGSDGGRDLLPVSVVAGLLFPDQDIPTG